MSIAWLEQHVTLSRKKFSCSCKNHWKSDDPCTEWRKLYSAISLPLSYSDIESCFPANQPILPVSHAPVSHNTLFQKTAASENYSWNDVEKGKRRVWYIIYFFIEQVFVCYAPAFSLPPKSLTKQAEFELVSYIAIYGFCLTSNKIYITQG